jgi:hypothetical protein
VECAGDTNVTALLALIEAETGLEAKSMVLQNSERQLHPRQTLEVTGIPLVSDIYVSTLTKIVVVEHLGIAQPEVTDAILATLCNELADKPFDILDAKKCANITELVSLSQLSQVSTLEISGCWRISGRQIADCMRAMGGLSCLDLSRCRLSASDCSEVADAITTSDVLMELDLSSNKLIRGALKAGKSGDFDAHYETDMGGICICYHETDMGGA